MTPMSVSSLVWRACGAPVETNCLVQRVVVDDACRVQGVGLKELSEFYMRPIAGYVVGEHLFDVAPHPIVADAACQGDRLRETSDQGDLGVVAQIGRIVWQNKGLSV